MVDFGIGQGKHLKAARVSKSWTVPASEFGEVAGFFNKFRTGCKNEMVSVGENGLTAEFVHFGMSNSFDRGTRSGADESWSLNIAMRRMNNAGAHEVFLLDDVEFEFRL